MSAGHDDNAHPLPNGTGQPANACARTRAFGRTRVATRRRSGAVEPARREHRGGGHRPPAHVSGPAADRGIDQADIARTGVVHATPGRAAPPSADACRREHTAEHGSRRQAVHDVQVPHDAPDRAEREAGMGASRRRARHADLPHLFNVLIGYMNIVGPRPEQPDIFVYLREQIESYPRRQRVRPGITGWAQVNQGYDTSVDDVRHKVRYDLEYIRRQSALEDLKIMLRTVPVMLLRRGSR